jgi:regulatory associated protein of mTOR
VVKIWNMDDTTEPISKFGNSCKSHSSTASPLSLIRFSPSVGFLNQKTTTPMTSMAFHPHHMVLGCSTGDGHINLFEMGVFGARPLPSTLR